MARAIQLTLIIAFSLSWFAVGEATQEAATEGINELDALRLKSPTPKLPEDAGARPNSSRANGLFPSASAACHGDGGATWQLLREAEALRETLQRMLGALQEEEQREAHLEDGRVVGGGEGEAVSVDDADNTANRARDVSAAEVEASERRLLAEGKCGAWDLVSPRSWLGSFAPGSLSWQPRPDAFLLADCHKGQTSNRMRCYRKFFLLAGLLNRTLVLPYRRTEVQFLYNPRLLVPLGPVRQCYGRAAALTTRELRRQQGGAPLRVDVVLCALEAEACYHQPGWGAPDAPPRSVDVEYPDPLRLHLLGFHNGGPARELVARVEAAAGGARIVLIKDIENVMVNMGDMVYEGDIPFRRARGCPNTLIPQPHPGLFAAARRFAVARGLGGPGGFLGLHWRRGDLMKFCDNWQCRLSPAQAAGCAATTLRAHGLTLVFLASDGNSSEVGDLYRHLKAAVPDVTLVTLPHDWRTQPWAQQLAAHPDLGSAEDDGLIASTLEKIVCAHAAVFLGTRSSSFSSDIERLRSGLRRSTCADTFLCSTAPKPKV